MIQIFPDILPILCGFPAVFVVLEYGQLRLENGRPEYYFKTIKK
jgi:hypothetical protein